jgi:hypothetical protein
LCSHGQAAYAAVMIALCAPQLAFSLWWRWSWPVRTLAVVAMFPAFGMLVALGMGWWDGYWTTVIH